MEELEWFKQKVKVLKKEGIIANALPDAYLHRVVLLAGRLD